MVKTVLLCLGIFAFSIAVLSQPNKSPLEIIEKRKQSVHNFAKNFYTAPSLSGKKYNLAYIGAKNSQFYNPDKLQNGVLMYDGIVYRDIEIRYDLFSQQIITLLKSQNNAHHVSIDNEKISKFSIGNHNFIHVREDNIMKDGIYQLSYKGSHSSIFIKRKKTKKEKVTTTELQIHFRPVNLYYVKNEYGTFHIANKKDLLKAYNNSEKLILILKNYKIKFSKRRIEKGLNDTISLLDSKLTVI